MTSWGLSSRMRQNQMLHLVDHGHRAIGYDRRGHGRSDDPGRGYDFDTLADDLAALLDQLDLSDVALVDHSMGGGEVVRYLRRHGGARVGRIALVASTVPCLMRSADNPNGVDGALLEGTAAAAVLGRLPGRARAAATDQGLDHPGHDGRVRAVPHPPRPAQRRPGGVHPGNHAGWPGRSAALGIVSLEVTAGADVAFAHALLRCGLPEELREAPGNRLRRTIGLRRSGGRWLVSHEHRSFPDRSA